MISWHRLFGLFLIDLFTDTPFVVEMEKDLSIKQQFLDVVILRKTKGEMHQAVPDGLEHLSDHNLLSYKSHQESFDDWALKELIGHYVNYRKQVSPSTGDLLPEDQFQLYGVSTRFPKKLATQVLFTPMMKGVYEVRLGIATVRIIVLSEVAAHPNNALWRLFSARKKAVEEASVHYRGHATEMSTIINKLYETYQLEGFTMSYTMQDFSIDFTQEHISLLPTEDRLRGLSTDDRLRGLSTDEILQRLSPEEIKAYLKQAENQKE